MRVALLSDIHGNRMALETVLFAIGNETPDRVVCLGDVAAMGPDPGGTFDLERVRAQAPETMPHREDWLSSWA